MHGKRASTWAPGPGEGRGIQKDPCPGSLKISRRRGRRVGGTLKPLASLSSMDLRSWALRLDLPFLESASETQTYFLQMCQEGNFSRVGLPGPSLCSPGCELPAWLLCFHSAHCLPFIFLEE